MTKKVTTAVEQTLTCTIGELDANGTPVAVLWRDPDDNVVSEADTPNYSHFRGTVDSNGVQNARLTITALKLAEFSSLTTFTYKCSAQYSGSPASPPADVVADILSFGQ